MQQAEHARHQRVSELHLNLHTARRAGQAHPRSVGRMLLRSIAERPSASVGRLCFHLIGAAPQGGHVPTAAPIDRHIVGSRRVRVAGGLESHSKYKQRLEVCWHVNPELVTRFTKCAQADSLVDQRIRSRK